MYGDGVLLRRSFAAMPLEVRDVDDAPDKLTVYGRVVPYGEVIRHNDNDPAKPWYRERFVRGALSDVHRYVHTVKLGFEHPGGYVSNVGRATAVEERDDGGYMSFKLYRSDAEKAVDHLTSTHNGLSLEFYSLHQRKAPDGVLNRLLVRVARVAALEEPAYAGAVVLDVRQKAPDGAEDVNADNGAQEPPHGAARANLDKALAIAAQIRRDGPVSQT